MEVVLLYVISCLVVTSAPDRLYNCHNALKHFNSYGVHVLSNYFILMCIVGSVSCFTDRCSISLRGRVLLHQQYQEVQHVFWYCKQLHIFLSGQDKLIAIKQTYINIKGKPGKVKNVKKKGRVRHLPDSDL